MPVPRPRADFDARTRARGRIFFARTHARRVGYPRTPAPAGKTAIPRLSPAYQTRVSAFMDKSLDHEPTLIERAWAST
jgi:hypothetical protein